MTSVDRKLASLTKPFVYRYFHPLTRNGRKLDESFTTSRVESPTLKTVPTDQVRAWPFRDEESSQARCPNSDTRSLYSDELHQHGFANPKKRVAHQERD